jgi:hypothetical protein
MAPKVLAIRTEVDGVLAAVAPLGLAAAAGTALMIDLDPEGPAYPGDRSLAELAADGPRRVELSPERTGVAVVRNGGVAWGEAAAVIDELIAGWPAVVLRVGREPVPYPVVRVVPLLAGALAPASGRAAVWQAAGFKSRPPGPGPVLPPLSRVHVIRLLEGRIEPNSRWVRAWRRVWELPWK